MDRCSLQTKKTYRLLGWDKRFSLPLRENPLNTTSYGLEVDVFSTWIEYFFREGRQTGKAGKIVNVDHAVPRPLSVTGSRTVYFTSTYGPDINVHE